MSQYGLRPYGFVPAGPTTVQARRDELHQVYRACFTQAPWHEDETRIGSFPQRLAQHLAHPGAGGILVEHRAGKDSGPVVAAVYGWPAAATLPRGTVFDDALAAAVPPKLMPRLTAPALVVAELMVDPAHRRKGIARTLLTRYTGSSPTAWLCTHLQAPAVALYESQGWRAQFTFTAGDQPLVVFLKPTR